MNKFPQTSLVDNKREKRLSLDQFRQLIQEHLTRIVQTQQLLQNACVPFQGRGDIRPIHCRLALESLSEVNCSIEELSEIFYRTSYLPAVVSALRYPVLLNLHRVERQIHKLEDLLYTHRLNCLTPSRQVEQQRKDINTAYEKLLQYTKEIAEQTNLLNDEARFEERRLFSLLEEGASLS